MLTHPVLITNESSVENNAWSKDGHNAQLEANAMHEI